MPEPTPRAVHMAARNRKYNTRINQALTFVDQIILGLQRLGVADRVALSIEFTVPAEPSINGGKADAREENDQIHRLAK